jgi:hypothetical protein
MRSKAAIVGRLLTEDLINAEEAVILLMDNEKKDRIPSSPTLPFQPVWVSTTTKNTNQI